MKPYLQRHMAEALRPQLYVNEDQAKDSRDPVALAKRSEQALEKALDLLKTISVQAAPHNRFRRK
jgi:hypothetical protein